MNRFQKYSTTTTTSISNHKDSSSNKDNHHERHLFDYSQSTSRLQPHKQSIILDYQRYQHFLSPWKTMKDEIRVLKPTTSNNSPRKSERKMKNMHHDIQHHQEPAIMIGFGSMGWSGGKWNCQPFCLIQVMEEDG